MTVTMLGLSFDCGDARRVAEFWAEVLDRPISHDASAESASVAVEDAATTGPLLMFHQVPEGKQVKNRLHFDLVTEEFESDAARLISLGATRLRDIEEGGHLRWATFADPEGNEFDLVPQLLVGPEVE
jgi:predicted enzyme related to lactoylglutathione lyase